MTKEELGSLETWFQGYLDRFHNRDGVLHPMLELKRSHSIRVAENARAIAAALKLPEAGQRLAEGAGLVHDAGCFTQFMEHGSFRDARHNGQRGEGCWKRKMFPFRATPGTGNDSCLL